MKRSEIIPFIFHQNTTEDYLNAALETESWLKGLEIQTPYGKIWRRSPELEDREARGKALLTDKCMYGGSAGIGFYYLRLYEVTGDRQYLQTAEDAASHILSTYTGFFSYRKIPEVESGRRIAGWATGITNGPAGEAFFLELLYRVDPKPEYLEFIVRIADELVETAIVEEPGIRWSDASDLTGDGGLTIFLLLAYRRTRDEKYLTAATQSAEFIATKAVDAPEGGIYWELFDITRIGAEPGTVFPNYTHGTAGAGWLFGLLYRETKDERYLKLAKESAAFLQNIAVGDENGTLVPFQYHPATGPTNELYYLGTCNGPVGTIQLFRVLYEITEEGEYLEWIRRLSRGIVRAGAPERGSWGYWPSACYCCGAPGVLEQFVAVYELTGEEEFLGYARRTANAMLGDSHVADGKRCWYGAWMRVDPTDVKSYTGLYIGSSGAAATLLRLCAAEKGQKISEFFEYIS